MSSSSLLIGNELPLYREVLVGVLHSLRPHLHVEVVPGAALDVAVQHHQPWLVICSSLSSVIEEIAPAWILLPNAGDVTVISVAGARCIIPHPTLHELLQIIDDMRVAKPLVLCQESTQDAPRLSARNGSKRCGS